MVIQERRDLARAIKAAMAARGITSAQLADAMHVSPPSMSRSIHRSDITIGDLQRMADAMGAALAVDFIDRDSHSNRA